MFSRREVLTVSLHYVKESFAERMDLAHQSDQVNMLYDSIMLVGMKTIIRANAGHTLHICNNTLICTTRGYRILDKTHKDSYQ